jgi:hypothetical protein
LGNVDQTLKFGLDWPGWVGGGGVAAPAVQFATGVQAQDIALGQASGTRNTMNDFFVDGGTADRRERHFAWHPLEKRDGLPVLEKLFDNGIQLSGAYARLNPAGGQLEGFPNDQPCPTHQGYFPVRA